MYVYRPGFCVRMGNTKNERYSSTAARTVTTTTILIKLSWNIRVRTDNMEEANKLFLSLFGGAFI